MDIRITKLNIRNFKGCESLEMVVEDGRDLVVRGDNATGKTTIFDSFCWVLFGKDSLNRADFEIKPIEGERGVQTEVEVELKIGDTVQVLKKIYLEKWTKKRGNPQAEFTGHEVNHYLDGVPVRKREYDSAVAEICPENLFRLLTNPRHFSEVLHWKERRALLLSVCGNITDEEVIASDSSLAPLPAILGKRDAEDHKKVIMARRTELNREIEQIPVRIDEVSKGIAGTDSIDEKTIKGVLAHLNSSLKAKKEQLARIETGGEVAEQTKKLREIEGKILDLENKIKREQGKNTDAIYEKIKEYKNSLLGIGGKIHLNQEALQRNHQNLDEYSKTMEALRTEFSEVRARTFTPSISSLCPTCGQTIPESQQEEARQKAITNFNAERATSLSAINKKGQFLKQISDQLKEQNSAIEKSLEELQRERWQVEKQLENTEMILKSGMIQTPGDTESISAEISSLQEQKEKIESSLSEYAIGSHDAMEEIRAELGEIESSINDQQGILAMLAKREESLKRIEELKKQERTLAAEFEQLEKELYLIEQFIRVKVRMLEDKINSRFRMARFLLFEEQINGGLAESCEVTYQGVPYGSMNNAARVNTGLDIIEVLGEYHQITPPIWIDNAEAITQILGTKAQQIQLLVAEGMNLTYSTKD